MSKILTIIAVLIINMFLVVNVHSQQQSKKLILEASNIIYSQYKFECDDYENKFNLATGEHFPNLSYLKKTLDGQCVLFLKGNSCDRFRKWAKTYKYEDLYMKIEPFLSELSLGARSGKDVPKEYIANSRYPLLTKCYLELNELAGLSRKLNSLEEKKRRLMMQVYYFQDMSSVSNRKTRNVPGATVLEICNPKEDANCKKEKPSSHKWNSCHDGSGFSHCDNGHPSAL